MKNTELYELLLTLTDKEFQKASVYLISFTNASKKGLLFFKEIEKAYQKAKGDWSKAVLTKEIFNQKIFGTPEDNSNARNLRSDLLKHLKSYCSFLQFQQKTAHNYLLEYYLERDCNDFLIDTYHKQEKKLCKEQGVAVLRQQYEAFEIHRKLMSKQQTKKESPDYLANYERFIDFSLLKKIQLYCHMLNRNIITKFDFPEGFDKEMELIFSLAKQREQIEPLVDLYETASRMLKGDKAQYLLLKELLEDKAMNLRRDDNQLLHVFLESFIISQNNQLELYRSYLSRFDKKLLHDGRFIPLMHAKNLCSILPVLLESEEEVSTKIKEIIQEIRPKYRDITAQYGLGVLYFYRKDYTKAIHIFQRKTTPNAFFDFDGRTILLRSYYLVEEAEMLLKNPDFEKTEAISNQARNFRRLLRKSLLGEEHKEGYFHFITALEMLYEIKEYTFSKQEKKELIADLNKFLEGHPVKAGHWFLKEVEVLL
mgnify:CR=1 FL=1